MAPASKQISYRHSGMVTQSSTDRALEWHPIVLSDGFEAAASGIILDQEPTLIWHCVCCWCRLIV